MTPVAEVAQVRAVCLAELRRKADRGDTNCLPWLIRQTARDPRLLTIHVWMVDQAVFGAPRFVALRHVMQAAAWCAPAKRQHRQHCPGRRQRTVRPATATLRWLLDGRTGGARWAAWLSAIGLDMGFKLTLPDPYSHDESGDNRAKGTPRVDIPHGSRSNSQRIVYSSIRLGFINWLGIHAAINRRYASGVRLTARLACCLVSGVRRSAATSRGCDCRIFLSG